MNKKENKTDASNEMVNVEEYVAAQMELNELRRQQGIEPKEGKLSSIISGFFRRRDEREKVLVSRKQLLLLTVFTGWLGGHRFYTKQYVLALMYLLFFWTCVPLAMAIIDLLVYIPIPPDENGNILV